MCNKLCNWVFCVFLMKCPALDASVALDGTGALDGIRASRVWTVGMGWTLFCSGRVGDVQNLDATSFGLVTLDRQGVADQIE